MSKICLILSIILISGSSIAQEAAPKVHKGNVLSGSAFIMGHLSSSDFTKLDTRWSQLPGYGWSGGLGLQLNFVNKWGAEVDFGYETNTYSYDHGNFRIELPYRVMYLAAKGTKFLQWEKDPFKFWYFKIGGAMHFGNGKTESKEAFNFEYTSTVTSGLLFSVMPEVGYHADLTGNHSLQFGLIGKIGLNDIITNNLNASPEYNTVTGISKGSYFGLTVKYFYGFTSLGSATSDGGHKSSYRKNI